MIKHWVVIVLVTASIFGVAAPKSTAACGPINSVLSEPAFSDDHEAEPHRENICFASVAAILLPVADNFGESDKKRWALKVALMPGAVIPDSVRRPPNRLLKKSVALADEA